MKSVLICALVASGLAITAPQAEAEERKRCAERASVVQRLTERYGETLRSIGLHQNTGVLEVYASEKTHSWTILVTMPNGMSCLLAAGHLWEGDAAPLTKPGKDA